MNQPYDVPSWASQLTYQPSHTLPLGLLPTPIQRWHLPHFPQDKTYWIKRDDLSGMALSGNKIRKLEFLLADAQAKGCDVVLTCGGIQSNHCRATAVAARRVGLDSVLFLRTKEPENDPGLSGNLLLHRLAGANIQLINHEEYRQRNALMKAHAETLSAQGRRPYIIPEGGSNALGAWGYIEAMREINTQAAQLGVTFDHIVFACGSGGTAAGLSLGAALSAPQTRVHAVNVCDDADYFYAHVDQVLTTLGVSSQARDILDMVDGYKGLGYAISQDKELQLLTQTAQQTGIFLDPVYTGKAHFGLLDQLQHHPTRFPGEHILFIHTGGLFGLYAKQDQLLTCLPEGQVQRHTPSSS
ncbi:MAG TPA: D-cysteine desulfhydrase family protein [Myxococcales bacterium]|nr:D-cysteine desulfhydrase [Deltaproteobacteria bacterium]HAA53152.1 D-cysteine desulfhydrase family protein [Myxococcales bacterium]|tara:strand:+ start:5105 stop:6172 length:1068 start_codon:yes stop_codon:yes gene_type:complete